MERIFERLFDDLEELNNILDDMQDDINRLKEEITPNDNDYPNEERDREREVLGIE